MRASKDGAVVAEDLNSVIAEMIEEDLAILDELVEEEIKPLADLGDPEKLIGKKFEEWTPEDMALLEQIYASNPKPLNKVVFDNTFQAMTEAEEAESAA